MTQLYLILCWIFWLISLIAFLIMSFQENPLFFVPGVFMWLFLILTHLLNKLD